MFVFGRVRSCLDLHLRVWMCKCSCLEFSYIKNAYGFI